MLGLLIAGRFEGVEAAADDEIRSDDVPSCSPDQAYLVRNPHRFPDQMSYSIQTEKPSPFSS